ncbi:MAG TPA: lysylphosphatidylglycerol synthase transmembrane domain-containing protein, partial [Desulfopila sp.]|nr:lysylphosphatidylglycerol synthase transmembrane domain-containing protein [Desulfopila sp.]
MKKNAIIISVKALISICFFVFLFSFLQENELAAVFANIDIYYFSLSMLILPVMLCTSCMKWWVLLKAMGKKVPFIRLTGIYLIGYFFSNILPSTVGGDVARSYYAGKEIGNQSYAAAATVIERLTGFLLLLFLVIFAPLCRPGLYGSLYLLIPALCSGIVLVLVVSIFRIRKITDVGEVFQGRWRRFFRSIPERVHSRSAKRICAFLEKIFRMVFERVEKFSRKLIHSVQIVRGNRQLMLKIVVLTFLFYFLTWINVYFAFLTFGYTIDFLSLVALVPTAMLVGQMPVTLLGNLGFFESVFVFYFL